MNFLNFFTDLKLVKTKDVEPPKDGWYLVADHPDCLSLEFSCLINGRWQENKRTVTLRFEGWGYFCPIPANELLSVSAQPERSVNLELDEIESRFAELKRQMDNLQDELSKLSKQVEPEPEEWDYQSQFIKGFAVVYNGEKWGVINEQGEVVIPVVYDGISNISDLQDTGVWVRSGMHWGKVNAQGGYIKPFEFVYFNQKRE